MNKSFVFALLVGVIIVSCNPPKEASGVRYYKSWKSYQVPYQPVEEVSYEDAKKLRAYYEAQYDADGKMVVFIKYLDGNVEFKVNYSYRKDGSLERGSITKSSGEVVQQRFDENGKLIIE